jgi:hypothetical protein
MQARFVRHLRIANQRARHAADIGLAACDHELRILRLVDAARDEDRHAQQLLEPPRVRRDVGDLGRHRRRDVHGPTEARRSPERHVDVIDAVAESDQRLRAFRLGQALVIGLGCRDPQADDELRGDLGAHVGDDLAQEPQTAVEIAAIGIIAQVQARIEELRRQITMACHDLHAVDARSLHASCGITVARDDLADQPRSQCLRHHAESLARHTGGRIGHAQEAAVGLGNFSARVE